MLLPEPRQDAAQGPLQVRTTRAEPSRALVGAQLARRFTNVGTGQGLQAVHSPSSIWPAKGSPDVMLLESGSMSKAMRIATAADSDRCASAQWNEDQNYDWAAVMCA